MRTTNKLVTSKVQEYILERIDLSGYDMENTPANLLKVFRSEYGHEIKRQGEQKAFCEWLAGVPSAINIEFYHDEIRETMAYFNLPDPDEKYTNEQVWDLYRYLLYRETVKLAKKEKV